MRRMVILATLVVLAQGIVTAGFSTSALQTARDKKMSRVRRVQVSARTVAKIPVGKKHVVDLTRDGVIYEFDPAAGSIDFKRIVVRNPEGEEAIESWMEKTFSKGALPEWSSQSFRVGATVDFRRERGLQPIHTSPPGPAPFKCDTEACTCIGVPDCSDMLSANICGDITVCTNRVCVCNRRA